ncbi:MAG: hypothetical protein FJ264_12695 [Planctomycetes bacterium]|nr:hypothetical protein [Planctomycetota bacterium]
MLVILLVIALVFTIVFYRNIRSFEKDQRKHNILYHFYFYSLEFLIPFIFVAALYSLIPIIVSISSKNANLQFLINLELFLTRLTSYFSFLHLSAKQVFFLFLFIFIIGLLRLPVLVSKKLLTAIDKYKTLTRRLYITLVLLCSFTLFGTQVGEPTNDLYVHIKTIRDGYADFEKDVQELIVEEVTDGLFLKVKDSFPDYYRHALNIPAQIGNEFVSLQRYYSSERLQYGLNIPTLESKIDKHLEKTNYLSKLDSTIRFDSNSAVTKGKSSQIDPNKVSRKKLKNANDAIIRYKNSQKPERVIKLLETEWGKQVIYQIPKVIVSEIKTALLKSWIEAYPILEPIIDVFQNTLNKEIENRIEKSIGNISKDIIQQPSDIEKTIWEHSSKIVNETIINVPKSELAKAKESSQQLNNKLNDVRNDRALLDTQVAHAKEWHAIQKIGSVDSFESFIKNNPKSPYVKDAQKELNSIWTKLTNIDSFTEYQNFVKNNPNTSLGEKAEIKINNLFKSSTPSRPKSELNSNLSVDVSWNAVPGANAYKVYWSYNSDVITSNSEHENVNNTHLKHWPNEFPVYYRVVAIREKLESKPSGAVTAELLPSKGGTVCQICGRPSIGYCYNRNIYVCRGCNYYTSKSGTYWQCP